VPSQEQVGESQGNTTEGKANLDDSTHPRSENA
jgi:hypothetical protein